MDYSSTLNLPKTDFPMRANLPEREPEILKQWEEKNIYKMQMEKNKDKPTYILHDGPPYANGDIHIGHALNKILKDVVVKYKALRGYRTPYVPGWDTHGLPTELRAIKALNINRQEISPVELRKLCKEFVLGYVDKQREQFKRLGLIGDWDNPYITLDPKFEAKQIEVFGEMAKKGYIYKGLRPVYWCADCETALAEAEIEYAEDKNKSIFVKFEVKDDKGLFAGVKEKVYFVIWTTTTWTLPGNMAVCLNADFDYALVKANNEVYVMAEELAEGVMKQATTTSYEILKRFKGSELEGIKCKHPFFDRESVVINGEHVTLEAGTGCVHTAPGHGQEDFQVCQKYGIEVVVPVDDKGVMNELAGQFKGLFYKKANKAIYEELVSTGHLFAEAEVVHQYPHCWRCREPILFRATKQWFASINGFREQALEAIKSVKWIPGWGEERITNMVRDRGDWCISRQRYWGLPIPIFYCADCDEVLLNDQTINTVKKLFGEKGSDVWYQMEAKDILPVGTKCKCGCTSFTKEKDIMDVWFDSGSTHETVLETRDDLSWPADMYLEGSDQHRGWFQSSLLTAVATRGTAPYKTVLTHGYTVDGEGKKMSKSLGNGVDPLEIIKEFGADVLRLWVASADYQNDVRVSKEIIKQMSEVYRKIRNTARFILGNISDFEPDFHSVQYSELQEIDKWAIMKVNKLIKRVTEAFENYEYHIVYHSIHNFCVVDMSNFYLDIIKDRLYTSKADSIDRRAAQTAMYEILDVLVRMLTPMLAFTTEEIWQYMPHRKSHDKESILLNEWPVVNEKYIDEKLEEKWNKILDIRSDVSKALEVARTEKIIGHSLNAKVTLYADEKNFAFLDGIKDELVTIFIVSAVELAKGSGGLAKGELTGLEIKVENAPGEKCERCWMYSESVGKDAGHPTLCGRCAGTV
ncbi:MAG: isoleucine--tRNA ligase [Deltaproteobacteria bacterium]